MKLQPLADRIVVEPLSSEEVTKGGIVLPDTAKEKPQEGKVIAVGEGLTLPNGQIKPVKIKVGDIVLYEKYGPKEIKTKDGDTLLIIREEEVLAIVK